LFIFWTVLTSIVTLSVVASYFLMDVENGKMFLAVSIAVYVYCAIFGFITVKESLPFSLKMGATRKNFFVAVGILFLGLSLVLAAIETLYHWLIIEVVNGLGIPNFTLIHIATLFDGGSWIYRFVIDLVFMFFMFASMFLLGLIFYRFGLLGGISVVGLLLFGTVVFTATGYLVDVVVEMVQNPSMQHYAYVFGIGITLYLISWLLLHNIPGKSARAV